MQNYDVCVFGAGPAGIAASMVLSQAGANVAIIRKLQAFPRTTKPCWETLTPRVETILHQLGLTDMLKDICDYRVTAHVSSWGSKQVVWESVMKRPDGGNWVVNRTDFDLALRKATTNQGIKIFETEVVDIKRNQDHWHLSIGGTRNFNITTSFLIDASGYGATVARRLGAKRIVVDKLVAQWLVFPTERDADRTIRIDSLEKGWLFAIRGGNQQLLCFFTDANLLKTSSDMSIKYAMEERILASPAIGSLIKCDPILPICTDGITFASTSILDRAVGKYWLACGDAAQTYDPLSSQGSYQALLSGYSAGASLIDCHNGDLLALENYDRQRRNEFIQYLKKLCKQYRLEHRWANSVFWSRRYGLLNWLK